MPQDKNRIISYEDIYDGDTGKNILHGKGKLKYTDGSTYDGDFVNNKKHGYGKYLWKNGNYYKGNWSEGMTHGKAELYSKKKDKIMKSSWKYGKLVE